MALCPSGFLLILLIVLFWYSPTAFFLTFKFWDSPIFFIDSLHFAPSTLKWTHWFYGVYAIQEHLIWYVQLRWLLCALDLYIQLNYWFPRNISQALDFIQAKSNSQYFIKKYGLCLHCVIQSMAVTKGPELWLWFN